MGDLPRPQRTHLFEDLYKEIIIRSPKKGRFFGVQGYSEQVGPRATEVGAWDVRNQGLETRTNVM